MTRFRQRYLQTETDVRRDAIAKKRSNNRLNENYERVQRGDNVQYFRRCNKADEYWRRPAVVLGIDGTMVVIRHGNKLVNNNMCDVRKFLNV